MARITMRKDILTISFFMVYYICNGGAVYGQE
nr:MAG TPA: hypothetical protein [Caudoviricetes sp.]